MSEISEENNNAIFKNLEENNSIAKGLEYDSNYLSKEQKNFVEYR